MPTASQVAAETGSKGSDWPVYRLFGVTLASDFAFANRLVPSAAVPDIRFSCSDRVDPRIDLDPAEARYQSPSRTPSGEPRLCLYHREDCDVLSFSPIADFFLYPERILCRLRDPALAYWVEIYLLGTVLAYWLERSGVLALHASAVVIEDQAVGLLASNGGGKSSLAAGLMQGGYRLLTDDVLAVSHRAGQLLGHPGYPSMRLWPGEAEHFLGHFEGLPRVLPELPKRRLLVGHPGFGAFCNQAQPLRCIYVPERRDPEAWGSRIEIVPLAPAAALIELVQHSFIPRLVAAAGWQARRLDRLAGMVERVSIRRLRYPSGFGYLPEVGEAIVRDLTDLGGEARYGSRSEVASG